MHSFLHWNFWLLAVLIIVSDISLIKVNSMTKGSVVGIVMVIFLVVFLIVDATCCYKKHCGLLMCIAVKVFGQKIPGMKMIDEGSPNGWVGAGSRRKVFVWDTQLFLCGITQFWKLLCTEKWSFPHREAVCRWEEIRRMSGSSQRSPVTRSRSLNTSM